MNVEIVRRVHVTDADVEQLARSRKFRRQKPASRAVGRGARQRMRRREVSQVEKQQRVSHRHRTVVFHVGARRPTQVDKRYRFGLVNDLVQRHQLVN